MVTNKTLLNPKCFFISYLSGEVDWSESDDHAWLDDAGLHPTHGDCPDAADLVHILQVNIT